MHFTLFITTRDNDLINTEVDKLKIKLGETNESLLKHQTEKLIKELTPPHVEKLGKAGVDILDVIFEQYPDLKDVDLSKITIEDNCPLRGYEKDITVPLDIARASQKFNGNTEYTIIVPGGYLTRFINFVTRCEYGFEIITPKYFSKYRKTQEVKTLKGSTSKYIFNSKELLEAWAKDGFPKRWGFNENL